MMMMMMIIIIIIIIIIMRQFPAFLSMQGMIALGFENNTCEEKVVITGVSNGQTVLCYPSTMKCQEDYFRNKFLPQLIFWPKMIIQNITKVKVRRIGIFKAVYRNDALSLVSVINRPIPRY